jgi:hypothetical protein
MHTKFLILATGTLIMIVVMGKTGATLKTPTTPIGILNLEFASNTQTVNGILLAWQKTGSTDNLKAATVNTMLDFIFLFFYSLFLYSLCNSIAINLGGMLADAGKIIAKGALVAGGFDIIENIGMLLSLNGHLNSAIAMVTFIAAVIKWCFVVFILLYVITGGFVVLLNKVQKKPSTPKY